ncbi:MAG: CRISPR-associated endonuclease Cas2 [Patescibacteria group bacterium]
MKIKIPITDKFLWGIYDVISGVVDISDTFSIKSINDIAAPGMKNEYLKYRKKMDRIKFSKFISYLKSRGYIQTPEIKGIKSIMITEKGMDKILLIKDKYIKLKKRKDKKWQMVLFDIPETERNKRNIFRLELKKLGYRNLQKSVWVSPYDVLEKTQSLIKSLSIVGNTRLLIVEEIVISHI